ncbi:hypothetical protein ASD76_13140 [Altererythrobacter sp. Root672]|nr:hypothetical protein ASD76_13140 [Altererythrobacter sp. Root672]
MLVTPEGEQRITLLNLSQGGARVRLPGNGRITGGILKWMDNEALGIGVWQAGSEMGLRFEDPIDWDWVVATRHWQPPRRAKGDDSRAFAEDWARGYDHAKFDAGAQLDEQARRNKAALDIHKLRNSGARIRSARLTLGVLLLSVVIGLGVGLWGVVS